MDVFVLLTHVLLFHAETFGIAQVSDVDPSLPLFLLLSFLQQQSVCVYYLMLCTNLHFNAAAGTKNVAQSS